MNPDRKWRTPRTSLPFNVRPSTSRSSPVWQTVQVIFLNHLKTFDSPFNNRSKTLLIRKQIEAFKRNLSPTNLMRFKWRRSRPSFDCNLDFISRHSTSISFSPICLRDSYSFAIIRVINGAETFTNFRRLFTNYEIKILRKPHDDNQPFRNRWESFDNKHKRLYT